MYISHTLYFSWIANQYDNITSAPPNQKFLATPLHLVPSPSSLFDSHGFNLCSTVHSRFHLPVLRFQILFWLLTAASLSSFLPSSPQIYINTNVSRVVQLRYPNIPISFVFCSFAWWLWFSSYIESIY